MKNKKLITKYLLEEYYQEILEEKAAEEEEKKAAAEAAIEMENEIKATEKLNKELQTRAKNISYFRFMGGREFHSLMTGKTIVNRSKHQQCRTDSVGFCFLRSDSVTITSEGRQGLTIFDLERPLEDVIDAIGGTCGSQKYFVQFAPTTDCQMRKTYGVYADRWSLDWDATVIVEEYSVTEYSIHQLRPIKVWRKRTRGKYGYKQLEIERR